MMMMSPTLTHHSTTHTPHTQHFPNFPPKIIYPKPHPTHNKFYAKFTKLGILLQITILTV
jgi:hypothetical protein